MNSLHKTPRQRCSKRIQKQLRQKMRNNMTVTTADPVPRQPPPLTFEALAEILLRTFDITPFAWKKAIDWATQVMVFYHMDLRGLVPKISKCVRIQGEGFPNKNSKNSHRLVPSVFVNDHPLPASFVTAMIGHDHIKSVGDLMKLLDAVSSSLVLENPPIREDCENIAVVSDPVSANVHSNGNVILEKPSSQVEGKDGSQEGSECSESDNGGIQHRNHRKRKRKSRSPASIVPTSVNADDLEAQFDDELSGGENGDSSVQLNAGPNDEAASEENVKKRILSAMKKHHLTCHAIKAGILEVFTPEDLVYSVLSKVGLKNSSIARTVLNPQLVENVREMLEHWSVWRGEDLVSRDRFRKTVTNILENAKRLTRKRRADALAQSGDAGLPSIEADSSD